ncbi:glycosyltransferase family 4 protein [bacterium]|nr:glycosyltransferase family 4 protein [bacterium]
MNTKPGVTKRRLRILYFIVRYPNFSETYMHEEIRSLKRDYDICIITYKKSVQPRRDPFPYQLIEYIDSCLVYGPINKVDPSFSSPTQREFIRQVEAVIQEFQPDLLHCHYFGLSVLLRYLSDRHGIPFTIRTHSMDMLSEPEEKIRAFCEASSSSLCKRILAFPAFTSRLVERGLDAKKVVACWPVINFARFYKPERRPPTRRVLCTGPSTRKKAHSDFIDLAARMRGDGFEFDLYAKGHRLADMQKRNERVGNPVRITYADPDDMPDIYPQYDWLVYPSHPHINKVGFPASIAEAQASGIGVCWQELPDRRQEQLEYLGGAGFLFKSIEELPEILSAPYPEEMRLAGLENSRKCDIEQHRNLLAEVWG